ncbi:MAG: T9SS type A sorting domain-containing protein [Bacteroidetes bacterium]|nr:T9SS type A sorting domain-containing protein [Bacteroidota bacterium]
MKTISRFYLRLLAILFLLPLISNAADYYWVGGSGNWSDYSNHWATSSGGSVFHAGIPTLNDDVIVDNLSFSAPGQTLLLDSTFYYCKSMTWSGIQFNPELQGNGATLYVYGSLTLDPSMVFSNTLLVFRGTGAGNTFSPGNQTFYHITFDSFGEYSLSDALHSNQDIRLQSGASLDANGYDITCRSIFSDNGTNITLGDIDINLDGVWNDSQTSRTVQLNGNVVNSASTNLFFHCNIGFVNAIVNPIVVDSISFSNTGSVHGTTANYLSVAAVSNLNTCTIGKALFGASDAYLTDCTFDTLQGHSFVFSGDATVITVNSLFDLQSDCNNLASLKSFNTPSGYTELSIPSGTVSIDWVNLEAIHAIGGATFVANNVIDLGNNTGWSITPITPRDLYWVGGSGNWNDGAHWSLTSGGSSAGCKPTLLDNAFFDANSFSGNDTVTSDQYEVEVNSLSVSGLTSNPMFLGSILSVYGSLTLDPQLRWQMMSVHLKGNVPLQTITTNGLALNYVEVLSGSSYQLQDDLYCEQFFLETGELNLNGNRLDATIVNTYSGTTLDAFNSTISGQEITLSSTVNGSNSTSLILDRPASALLSPGNFYSVLFLEDGVLTSDLTAHYLTAYSNLEVNDTVYVVVADLHKNTHWKSTGVIDSLLLNNGGYDLTLDPGVFLNINATIISNGDCNHLVGINSSVYGQQANIGIASGPLTIDYVQVSNIIANSTITANNSIDAGNNLGWTINSPASRNLFWIGGSGNWSDAAHWSLSSGGSAASCIPSAVDNVVVDSNSGLASGTMTVDLSNAAVHNIDLSNAGPGIVLTGENLQVMGSMSLASGMDWQLTTLTLSPQSGTSQITSSGTRFFDVVVNGSGTISLNDEWYGRTLDIQSGSFDLNGQDLSTSVITSATGTNFISGAVTITVANFYLQGSISNSSSTDFICKHLPVPYNVNNLFLFRTSGTYRDITVMESGLSFLNTDVNCRVITAYGDFSYAGYASVDTVQKMVAFGNLTTGSLVIDTLFLNNPGKTTNMVSSLTIGSELIANGTPAFPILLQGSTFAVLNKASGQVCLSDVLVSNVTTGGGAQFYAGQGCVDLGGNTGWQFIPCTVTSDVWPGDANYDLICDNVDILNIGVAFNESGPLRTGASTSWVAQPANDFGTWFSNAVNMKHADCDGDGTVNYADTLAVNQNYSLNHPARLANVPNHIDSSLPPLTLVASPDTVAPSATVFVDVQLGTSLLPVDSLYGIAFSVHYDPAIIDANSLHADFAGSWLGTVGTDMIGFVRNNPAEGRVDFTLCRTDHTNIYGGNGHLVLFDVVVVDNISTLSDALFSLSNVTAITYTQFNLAIGRMNDTITVDPLLGIHKPVDFASNFFVFPNPAKDKVTIVSHDVQLKSILVYDMQGRIVQSVNPGFNEATINLINLSSGVYEMRCITDKGDYHSRLQITR